MKAVTDMDDHISRCHRASTRSILFILAAAGPRAGGGGGALSAEAGMDPGTFLNRGENPWEHFLKRLTELLNISSISSSLSKLSLAAPAGELSAVENEDLCRSLKQGEKKKRINKLNVESERTDSS